MKDPTRNTVPLTATEPSGEGRLPLSDAPSDPAMASTQPAPGDPKRTTQKMPMPADGGAHTLPSPGVTSPLAPLAGAPPTAAPALSSALEALAGTSPDPVRSTVRIEAMTPLGPPVQLSVGASPPPHTPTGERLTPGPPQGTPDVAPVPQSTRPSAGVPRRPVGEVLERSESAGAIAASYVGVSRVGPSTHQEIPRDKVQVAPELLEMPPQAPAPTATIGRHDPTPVIATRPMTVPMAPVPPASAPNAIEANVRGGNLARQVTRPPRAPEEADVPDLVAALRDPTTAPTPVPATGRKQRNARTVVVPRRSPYRLYVALVVLFAGVGVGTVFLIQALGSNDAGKDARGTPSATRTATGSPRSTVAVATAPALTAAPVVTPAPTSEASPPDTATAVVASTAGSTPTVPTPTSPTAARPLPASTGTARPAAAAALANGASGTATTGATAPTAPPPRTLHLINGQ